MKFLPVISLGVLGLSGVLTPAHAQAINYNRVAIVRAYEQSGNNSLIIHYGDNEVSSSKLEGRVGRKDQEIVAGQLQEMVERFYNQGYHMLGMTSAGLPSGTVTTFVFRKDDPPVKTALQPPAPAPTAATAAPVTTAAPPPAAPAPPVPAAPPATPDAPPPAADH